ncbi:MAG: DUF6265 family protein [Bacteroidales bacterium]
MKTISSAKRALIISGFLFLLFCVISSCQNRKNNRVSALYEILEGEWKMPDQEVIERWNFNGEFLEGQVFEISGSDTLITEELRIIELDGHVIYEPTVKNQNQGKLVAFKLVEAENKKWVFENTGHDFPQQIEYNFITNDSLVATIKGEIIGVTKTIEFVYLRQE